MTIFDKLFIRRINKFQWNKLNNFHKICSLIFLNISRAGLVVELLLDFEAHLWLVALTFEEFFWLVLWLVDQNIVVKRSRSSKIRKWIIKTAFPSFQFFSMDTKLSWTELKQNLSIYKIKNFVLESKLISSWTTSQFRLLCSDIKLFIL